MYLYPRLRRSDAAAAIAQLESVLASGKVPSPFVDGTHHPQAVFPNSGGEPVPVYRLADLRQRVSRELSSIPSDARNAHRRRDAIVGKVLNEWFEEEGRAIAAHPEVWPYLALVVLPDFATQRFGPGADGRLPAERFLSGRRNVLYRVYHRSWILGPLLQDPSLEVYEDELVGIVDRSLSADHRLASQIAKNLAVLGSDKGVRRFVARKSLADVQYELRVTDIASLPDEQMAALVDGIFLRNVVLAQAS